MQERDRQIVQDKIQLKATRAKSANARERKFNEIKEKNHAMMALGVDDIANGRAAHRPVQRPTAASKASSVSTEQVHQAARHRASGAAHGRSVAGGGYDLKNVGRAIPAWIRPVVT